MGDWGVWVVVGAIGLGLLFLAVVLLAATQLSGALAEREEAGDNK